ncbi:MAG: 6-pyruvoyl-tetrahydropterin synthase-related protein, partial [Chloroflexota bacterium]
MSRATRAAPQRTIVDEPAARWWAAGSILLGLLAAAPLLLHAGFLNTRSGGDSPFLLFRLHQLYRALADGVFPVRWMPDAAFGLGYPFFSYYAALPYYAAALFHWLGLSYVLSLKLTHLLGFVIAAWGMYHWVKAPTGRPAAAFLASAAYTFAPYHLVNVYLRGDSLAEFWAMAWLPWIMLAIHRAARRPNARTVAGVGLAFGALLMTHNVTALIAAPFIALYALIGALVPGESAPDREGAPPRRALLLALGGLLGLALAAWAWLPALAEQGYVQLEAQT